MSRKTGSAYGPPSHSHSWRYGCYERGSGLWLTTQTRDALQRRTPSGEGTTCTNGSQLECLKISDGAKGNGRSTRDTLPLRAGDDACARYLCDLSFAAVCVLSALVEQAPSVCLSVYVQHAALKKPTPFGRTLSLHQSATRRRCVQSSREWVATAHPLGNVCTAARLRAKSPDEECSAAMHSACVETCAFSHDVLRSPLHRSSMSASSAWPTTGYGRAGVTGSLISPLARNVEKSLRRAVRALSGLLIPLRPEMVNQTIERHHLRPGPPVGRHQSCYDDRHIKNSCNAFKRGQYLQVWIHRGQIT